MKLTHLQTELDQDVEEGIAWKGDTSRAWPRRWALTRWQCARRWLSTTRPATRRRPCSSAKFLRPVRKAPFYAINMAPSVLVSVGGIRVNGNLQVTDKQYKPIPGLYAVGLEASGLYGDTYNLDVPGTANGFAHASGRVAARHVIKTLKGA